MATLYSIVSVLQTCFKKTCGNFYNDEYEHSIMTIIYNVALFFSQNTQNAPNQRVNCNQKVIFPSYNLFLMLGALSAS